MAINDPIGDVLTRIRNALHARHAYTYSNSSSEIRNVLNILKQEGYITDFVVENVRTNIDKIKIDLKYNRTGESVIKEINRVSKPGRRVYATVDTMSKSKFRNGLGVKILSTSKGVMTDSEALHHKVGGEVLCNIF